MGKYIKCLNKIKWNAYFWINDKDLTRFFSNSNERVNEMGAHVHWYIFNAISTNARPVDRPITEVAYYTRFAVRC